MAEGGILAALEGLFGAVLGHLGGPFERVPSSRGLGGGLRGVPAKVWGALGGLLEAFRRGWSRTTRIHWTRSGLKQAIDVYWLVLFWSSRENPETSQESKNMQLLRASALSVSRARPPGRPLDGSRMAPDAPKTVQDAPKTTQDAPQAPPLGALGSPRMTDV